MDEFFRHFFIFEKYRKKFLSKETAYFLNHISSVGKITLVINELSKWFYYFTLMTQFTHVRQSEHTYTVLSPDIEPLGMMEYQE